MWKEEKNWPEPKAVCEHMWRYIALDIEFPWSTSDFLFFVNSYIYRKLNEEEYLVPSMCFYGDIAYTINLTMTDP